MHSNIIILKYAVCYLAFFSILLLCKVNGGYKLYNEKGPAPKTGIVLGSQIAGILWLGAIPAFIFTHSWSEIVCGNKIPGSLEMLIMGGLWIATILLARIQSQRLFDKIVRNQKPIQIFSPDLAVRYILLRCLFLIAYEIFFRGYLLADSIFYFGITKAVLLNILLYTLLHAPADKKEMFACIPFGTLLCLVCIWQNAVWPAIALHVLLSLVYDINLLKKFSTSIKALS